MVGEILFVIAILGCLAIPVTYYVIVAPANPKPIVTKKPSIDTTKLVMRYTPYVSYQETASQWSGYQTISKEDLSELGFTGIQSELLFHLTEKTCLGGFSLASGILPDWDILRSSEITEPLIGEKYLAIDIIVADEYRGQGLADYMVRKIVQSHGPIRHLMWNAGTENEASLKLARRYGFVSFATTTEPDNSTTIHLIRKAGGR